MQANWFSHSLLLTHSGLQFGGVPEKSGKQEQEGELFTASHREFGPQGELSHGLVGVTVGLIAKEKFIFFNYNNSSVFHTKFLLIILNTYVEGSKR